MCCGLGPRVSPSTTISWSSDATITEGGWEICLVPSTPAPTPPAPTPEPTLAPSPRADHLRRRRGRRHFSTHARADRAADLEADAHSHARSASDADGDHLPQRRAGRDGDRRGLRRAVVPAVRAVELVRSRHGLSDGRVRELGVRARADTRADRRADAEPDAPARARSDEDSDQPADSDYPTTPLPSPAPSPAPTRTPIVVVTVGISGVDCTDYRMDTTVFTSALGDVLTGDRVRRSNVRQSGLAD